MYNRRMIAAFKREGLNAVFADTAAFGLNRLKCVPAVQLQKLEWEKEIKVGDKTIVEAVVWLWLHWEGIHRHGAKCTVTI